MRDKKLTSLGNGTNVLQTCMFQLQLTASRSSSKSSCLADRFSGPRKALLNGSDCEVRKLDEREREKIVINHTQRTIQFSLSASNSRLLTEVASQRAKVAVVLNSAPLIKESTSTYM